MGVLRIINLKKKPVGDCKQYLVGLETNGLDTKDGYVTYLDCEGIQQTVNLTRVETADLDAIPNFLKMICATYIVDQSDNVTVDETGKNCDGSEAVGPAYPTYPIGGGSSNNGGVSDGRGGSDSTREPDGGFNDLRREGVGDEDTRTN